MRAARIDDFDGVLRFAMPAGKNEAIAIKNKFNSIKRTDRVGRLKMSAVSSTRPVHACSHTLTHTIVLCSAHTCAHSTSTTHAS